jgi:hypothetical protein
MNYFAVELRHGENKQVWIACCETEAEAALLAREAVGALPEARAEAQPLRGDPPFRLKPDTVKQWT